MKLRAGLAWLAAFCFFGLGMMAEFKPTLDLPHLHIDVESYLERRPSLGYIESASGLDVNIWFNSPPPDFTAPSDYEGGGSLTLS